MASYIDRSEQHDLRIAILRNGPRCRVSKVWRHCAGSVALVAFGVGAAQAQQAAPITVTPPTLAPEHVDNGFRVAIPEAGALRPPAGAENLAVTLGDVVVEGGFAEVADQTRAIVARLKSHRASLADIYAAASEIEAIHARAGYVLARVSVPPQDLRDGGALRIVVTDGWIEKVDVSGLPRRVRGAVRARSGYLENRHHLTLRQIEEPLLLANDISGLGLRSTLMRGSQPGTTTLLLEGSHHLVSGSIGADNQLDPSLGTYGVNMQLALNSALGLGEQFYGFVSQGYDPAKWFTGKSPVRVLGGGVIVPFASGHLSLNPEVTFSRTLPVPAFGAPQTKGRLRRLSLRANYTLTMARSKRAGISLTVEQLDEQNTIPAFAFAVSHDRYAVARFGASLATARPDGHSFGMSAQLSQGLGNLAAITAAQALVSSVPYSRQGSSLGFTKLNAQFNGAIPLGKTWRLSAQLRGQTGFGKALFRSEQFALEGREGVSAYSGGITAVDEGASVRAELGASWPLGHDGAGVAPYVFAGGGAGRVVAPTALEPSSIKAAALGAGVRVSLGKVPLSLSAEYARGFSDYAPLKGKDRANVSMTLRF